MFEKLIARPTLVTVIALILCVLGIAAALRIPVQMIPDLDVRVISVRTSWPGAIGRPRGVIPSPSDMNSNVSPFQV